MSDSYSCSSCDIFSRTAPLCIDGDSYGWSEDKDGQGIAVVGPCACICHKGSADADAPTPDDGKGPGMVGDIDREYHDLCVHERQGAAA